MSPACPQANPCPPPQAPLSAWCRARGTPDLDRDRGHGCKPTAAVSSDAGTVSSHRAGATHAPRARPRCPQQPGDSGVPQLGMETSGFAPCSPPWLLSAQQRCPQWGTETRSGSPGPAAGWWLCGVTAPTGAAATGSHRWLHPMAPHRPPQPTATLPASQDPAASFPAACKAQESRRGASVPACH